MTANRLCFALWILIFLAPAVGVQPANAADDELRVNAEAVRKVIESSRYENGDLRSVHKKIALYVLADDSIEQSERELFDKFVFTEVHLLGRMLPIWPAFNSVPPYPYGAPYSSLVVFRDPDDTKIPEFASQIPGIVAWVNGVKGELADDACRFFFRLDGSNSDDFLVAYIFVGRNHPNVEDCLQSHFARAFGVARILDRNAGFTDRYLTELLAMRAVGLCTGKHGQERLVCALSKAESFK